MKKNNLIIPPLTKEQQVALWNAEHGLDKGWIELKQLTLEQVLEEYSYLISDKEKEELIKRYNDNNNT